MVLRKATAATEAGVAPSSAQRAELSRLIEETTRSGVHLVTETMRPSARGRRYKNSRDGVSVYDGPVRRDQGADRRLRHRVGGVARRRRPMGGCGTSRPWKPTRWTCANVASEDRNAANDELRYTLDVRRIDTAPKRDAIRSVVAERFSLRRNAGPVPEEARTPSVMLRRDFSTARPVDDAAFKIYRDM